METTTARIAELEREEAELREKARRLWARAEACAVERRLLAEETPTSGSSTSSTLADAVLAVLAEAGRSMSPKEIHEALVAVGREDDRRSIGGTLNHLKSKRLVISLGRGQWRATV